MLTAITREINPSLGHCELTYQARVPIDVDLAEQQHRQYQAALSTLGCEIFTLPTEPGLADSVFIEDTALILDDLAILCRPGATSRRPEIPAVGQLLNQHRKLAPIRTPGTLDGGDLLLAGRDIFAGLSTRSNQAGIEQLRRIVGGHGPMVASATSSSLFDRPERTSTSPVRMNSGIAISAKASMPENRASPNRVSGSTSVSPQQPDGGKAQRHPDRHRRGEQQHHDQQRESRRPSPARSRPPVCRKGLARPATRTASGRRTPGGRP